MRPPIKCINHRLCDEIREANDRAAAAEKEAARWMARVVKLEAKIAAIREYVA
jgi:hypothetical protein